MSVSRQFLFVVVVAILAYARFLQVQLLPRNDMKESPIANSELVNSTGSISFCFIVSVYAPWAAHADQLQRVDKLPWYNQSHFFAFTNLPKLRCKGWTQVVDRPPYRRLVTQSRYSKFWAWNLTRIQSHCQVVFYMDSIGHIVGSYENFVALAEAIWQSPEGHAQYLHKGGGGAFGEFRRIEVFHKDIDENIQASKKWLLEQPDFLPPAKHNCTLYENRYIGYAVRPNTTFAKTVSECFWKRYSLELDSWRDQPLWCYCLDRFNVTPIPLDTSLWQLRPHRMGKLGHQYKSEREASGGVIFENIDSAKR